MVKFCIISILHYPVSDGGGRVLLGLVLLVASGVLNQRLRELLREVVNFAKVYDFISDVDI